MIAGIILAAGMSSRLGRPKQLLELEGRIVLQHVVDAAEDSGLNQLVVVLGHRADEVAATLRLPEKARTVVNLQYAAGQATSLRAGLDALDPRVVEAAVILLGDQPHVQPNAIRAVIDAYRATGVQVIRARYGSDVGHPILLAHEGWPFVRQIEGDVGARRLIRELAEAHPESVQDVDVPTAAPEDIDTWEDYERLRERGRPRP